MIGPYLLTLSAEQEDRVLTQAMQPGMLAYICGSFVRRCLLGVVLDVNANTENGEYPTVMLMARYPTAKPFYRVAVRYDALCERFGVPRVNAAIRNRILSNRARRMLSRETQSVCGVREPQQGARKS